MSKKQIVVDFLSKTIDANTTVAEWLIILNTEGIENNYFVDITENPDDYTVSIWYRREETDDEYEKRIAEIERIHENVEPILKKQRYLQYLKLKEEFESK